MTTPRATFDRTYEGLKQGTARHLMGEAPAFDRTYEGLKLGHARGVPRKAKAFDRTYEGLKLENVLGHQVHGPLLTVPMRV